MEITVRGKRNPTLLALLSASGLVLAMCLADFPASAQQNPPGEAAPTVQQQGGENAPGGTEQSTDSSYPTVPATLTVPAGTVISVRVNEWLSSDRNQVGDGFNASLDRPVIVDGWVVARRGQLVMGRVSTAQKAGRVSGTSKLAVELSDLTLVDGQQLPLQTQMLQTSAGTSNGRDAAAVGTTTGIGAVIGAGANGGEGAAVGAGIGAAAGIIGVLVTRGRPTVIPPETLLTFRLQTPLTISTERSQFAFQPVTQQDQDAYADHNRPQRRVHTGPAYPPPYYGYPYPYIYAYPYPYEFYPVPFSIGFYGGYGFGHRFGGFRP
jgi:hypothetical protein